ncbi:MAG: DUF5688 family protein [Clostridiales bacterium]|nr:DUF5688 family protein [Clostridiales bacterium]
MTYQQFQYQICQFLEKELGSNQKLIMDSIIKNNDTRMDGITILSDACNLAPTIYLNPFFLQYKQGREFSEIADDIFKLCHSGLSYEKIDTAFFTDYEKVKSRIVFQLIHFERNQARLKTLPHFRFLDFAIVFCCLLESSPTGTATILIHNSHLDFWTSVTREDLHALAAKNTPALLKYELRKLSDVLKERIPDADNVLASSKSLPCPLYVLSNQYKINGASCILYENLLQRFADRIKSDLYILPSSIHEVLILPVSEKSFTGSPSSVSDLNRMVQQVNATQLSGEEILSDHVYYFSRETGQLHM